MLHRFVCLAFLTVLGSTAFAQTEFEMRPRPTDESQFPEYIQYFVDVAEPRTAEERAQDAVVKKKFRRAVVADSLFVGGPGFPAGFSVEQYEEAVRLFVRHYLQRST